MERGSQLTNLTKLANLIWSNLKNLTKQTWRTRRRVKCVCPESELTSVYTTVPRAIARRDESESGCLFVYKQCLFVCFAGLFLSFFLKQLEWQGKEKNNKGQTDRRRRLTTKQTDKQPNKWTNKTKENGSRRNTETNKQTDKQKEQYKSWRNGKDLMRQKE